MVPTIRDVAQRAGVSISTVSRVLNKSAGVAEAKRERVKEAASALGYSPNPNALSLLGQSTGGIGVLLPYIAGDFFSEFLEGIDRTTRDNGYYLIVSSTHRVPGAFRAAIQGMHRRVDGLIVMSTQDSADSVKAWLPDGLPVVFVNSEVEDRDLEVVNIDNRGGAYMMTEHLIGLGHRRIAFLRGAEGSTDALERLDGYRAALEAHGLTTDPALEFEGDFTLESGERAVPAILEADPRPTALFASNDLSAYGALSGLREAGLRVPDDLSLAGFDDVPLARIASPTLTTVHAPVQEMGQRAIERLLAQAKGTEGHGRGVVQLPTELAIRESTAPPTGSRAL